MGSSNTIKVFAGALVLLAIILAIVAFKMSRSFAESQAQTVPAAPETQKTLAVVSTKPLLANQPIEKDSIALIPIEVAPKDYFANVDDVVGRAPLVDIDAGSPLTPRSFAETNQLVRLIPAGTRALAFELTDVLGVGNFVKSGDVVDVLVYIKGDQQSQVSPAQARVLLKDALVLAYDERITATPQDAKRDDSATAQSRQQNAAAAGGRHQRTIVLAVPESDLTTVLLGAGLGEIRLALHGSTAPDNGSSLPTTVAATVNAPEHYVRPDADALAQSSHAISAAAFWGPNDSYAQGNKPKNPQYSNANAGGKKVAPRENGITVYRGTKHETVYP